MFKLNFYVPEKHLEKVKRAIFQAGAGKIGNYDCCCWQTLGEGQFRPLEGSNPHIGSLKEIEKVAEYKVECVVEDSLIRGVIDALIAAHPYEEPAYEVLKMKVDF